MDRVRIGAVSYLNARPLVFGLEQGMGADRLVLSHGTPAEVADRLAAGALDIALVPSIELARIPDLTVAPGLAITSFGPARSVLLVSKCEPAAIRRLALDPESRTTNALVRILLEGRGTRPECEPGPIDLHEALRTNDAVVRIGDKALFEPIPPSLRVLDLGEAWTERTRMPFVYAVWAARDGALGRDVYETLHRSLRAGLKMREAIADDYTWQGRRDPGLASRYLREAIRYRMGSDEVKSLRRFFEDAARIGLVEAVPEVRLASFGPTTCAPAGTGR